MKRIVGVALALLLLCSCFAPALAMEEEKTILSLGDSISAGYGLKSESDSFVYDILENAVVMNYAVSGNTADDVWAQLSDDTNEKFVSAEKIEKADIVTITCGGNDLMAVLYSKMAEAWNEANPDKEINPFQIIEKLMAGDLSILKVVAPLFDKTSDKYVISHKDFDDALEKYVETLKKITLYINLINPSCAVIVATQYNPYSELKGTLFGTVYSGVEDGVCKLNEAIEKNASSSGYMVSQVKSRFDSSKEKNLCNVDLSTMNFDFHPNENGHRLLAESFSDAVEKVEYVKCYISHNYETLDGGFEEEKEEISVVSGVFFTAKAKIQEGFTSLSRDDSVKSVWATEGAELKLHYSRNTYSISWCDGETVITKEYKYGEKITAETLKKKGYKFLGWDKEVPETQPSKNLDFEAVWEKRNNLILIFALSVIGGCALSAAILLKRRKNKK